MTDVEAGRTAVVHRSVGGFIAGTLVHGEHAPVPIEQIRAGDRLLARPASGEGAPFLKRVLAARTFDDVPILHLVYQLDGRRDLPHEDRLGFLCVGGDALLWVTSSESWTARRLGREWVRVDHLYPGAHVLLAGEQSAMVAQLTQVDRTARSDVGFIRPGRWDDNAGATLDLTGALPLSFPQQGLISPNDPGLVVNDLPDWPYLEPEEAILRRRVFGLELEDDHAYFVGVHGVCVNCSRAT